MVASHVYLPRSSVSASSIAEAAKECTIASVLLLAIMRITMSSPDI